jgi:hypothetical protein
VCSSCGNATDLRDAAPGFFVLQDLYKAVAESLKDPVVEQLQQYVQDLLLQW